MKRALKWVALCPAPLLALIASPQTFAALDGLSDGPMGVFQLTVLFALTTAPFWGGTMLLAAVFLMMRGFKRAGNRDAVARMLAGSSDVEAPDLGRRWMVLSVIALVGVLAALYSRPYLVVNSAQKKYEAQQEIRFEKAVFDEADVAKDLDQRLKTPPRKPMPSLKPIPIHVMKAAVIAPSHESIALDGYAIASTRCTIAVWDRSAHATFQHDTPALLLLYDNANNLLRAYGQSPEGTEYFGVGAYFQSALGLLGSKPPFVTPLNFTSREEVRLTVTSRAACNRDRTVCTLKGELIYPPYPNVGLHQQCPAGIGETLLPRGAY
jgi:hypothetical protein